VHSPATPGTDAPRTTTYNPAALNASYADRALATLRLHKAETPETLDLETPDPDDVGGAAVDLISDLLHLVQRHGHNVDAVLESARENYGDEVDDATAALATAEDGGPASV
jgi:hypothetical protein